MRHSDLEVVIVGGGLAGLACAAHLQGCGVSVRLLEASDAIGGRVRTDIVEGFQLDRGFQVLLTAYPEAAKVLDYEALDLRTFDPGALVRVNGAFHTVADPWRRPDRAAATLAAPVGTLADKLRMGRLRSRMLRDSASQNGRSPTTTLEALEAEGFSPAMIECFFRPFLAGVFLENELSTSSRMFEFVFRMFALGDAALPARGMGAIPQQLADRLEPGTIRTRTAVASIDEKGVLTGNGDHIEARAVVVACDAAGATALLPQLDARAMRSVTCVYYAADEPPVEEPVLLLDGEGGGPVNNLCVPSQVASTYAPGGASLVSASIIGVPQIGDQQLDAVVRGRLSAWFGSVVHRWRHLRTYRITHALPAMAPGGSSRPVRLRRGLYVCGDHREEPSLQGSLVSGRRAAEAVLEDLERSSGSGAGWAKSGSMASGTPSESGS